VSILGTEESGEEPALLQEIVPQEMVPQEIMPQETVPQETVPQEAEDLHQPRIHHHLITEGLREEDHLGDRGELRISKVPSQIKSRNQKSSTVNQEKTSILGGCWYKSTSKTSQKGFRKTRERSTG
jgi:hypothetical protein